MNEDARKASHLVIGAGIAALILLIPRDLAIIALGAGLLGGLMLIDLCIRGWKIPLISELLSLLERDGSFPGKGAVYFVASALATTILFPANIAAAAVLVLAVLDGMATIGGRHLGRHRIWNGRSIEGSLIGIASAVIILVPLFPLPTALATAVIAGCAELVTPIDDNLVIPPVAALVLYAAG